MSYHHRFDGQSVATLAALLFLARYWEFERPVAKASAATFSKSLVKKLYNRIAPKWVQMGIDAGIKGRYKATKPLSEVIEDIRNLYLEVELNSKELRLLIAIAETVKQEFTGNWIEFMLVTPGNIEHFDVNDNFIDNFQIEMQTLLDGLEETL